MTLAIFDLDNTLWAVIPTMHGANLLPISAL